MLLNRFRLPVYSTLSYGLVIVCKVFHEKLIYPRILVEPVVGFFKTVPLTRIHHNLEIVIPGLDEGMNILGSILESDVIVAKSVKDEDGSPKRVGISKGRASFIVFGILFRGTQPWISIPWIGIIIISPIGDGT
jgi:hypothetical protein